jgi:hypothetical protein
LQHTKMCSVANLRQADETLRRNDSKKIQRRKGRQFVAIFAIRMADLILFF